MPIHPRSLPAELPVDLTTSDYNPYDLDGVLMLHHPEAGGTNWRLGSSNPNNGGQYFRIYEATATQVTEGGRTFWREPGQSDGNGGRTHRLYIRAGGGVQNYTWNSNPGYLGSPADIQNLECTGIIRATNKVSGNTSLQWELRGGNHGSIPAQAGTFGMQVPYIGQTAKCFREYNHPQYDYIFPPRKFVYNYPGNAWLGMKCTSYLVNGGTQCLNRLYLDTSPYNADGSLRNDWQLYLEYLDTNTDTGLYTVPALWSGWQNFIRMDGWQYLDFTIYSAREIVPP